MKHKVHLADHENATACGIEFELLTDVDHSVVWQGVTCEACLATRDVAKPSNDQPGVYDPLTCITAKELRLARLHVPDVILDCAWTPRSKIIPRVSNILVDKHDPSRYAVYYSIEFSEPFRWVDGQVTLENSEENE